MVSADALAREVVKAIREVWGGGALQLHRPYITEEDVAFVGHAARTEPVGYSYLDEFERELSLATGARYVVAVASGTAALHLALLACGVKPNDSVLVPPLTFAGAAAAVRYCGANPTFAAAELFTAEMCVDLLGDPDRQIVSRWLTPGQIPTIEDAAAALGSRYRGRACGTFGKFGILSFNNNKIVTTGGGGAVLTDDVYLADKVRHLATTAKVPSPFLFEHDAVGYNYRMPNLAAALGLGQLLRLPSILRAKRKLHEAYVEAFAELEEVRLRTVTDPDAQPNYWLNSITVPGEARDTIMTALLDDEVQCRALFTPLPDLPMYVNAPEDPVALRKARHLFKTTICIPSGAMS